MPILAKTYQGIQGGMNQAVPQHEIPDGQASYMQDIILSVPGIIKRRGPISKISGSAQVPTQGVGIIAVQDMLGVFKVAVLGGDSSNAYLSFYNTALSSITGPYSLNSGQVTKIPKIVDAKAALGNGAIIGASSTYVPGNPANVQAEIMFWRGAALAANITATNVSVTFNTTGVTSGTAGAFTNVTPGMFMYNGNTQAYIGTVASVASGTILTLENPALGTLGIVNATFTPVRPIMPKAMKGRISIAPGSLIVNGTQGPQGTKFVSQGVLGLVSGLYYLFRLSDNALIGQVNTVTDNVTLTISSNNLPTGTGLTNERYYILKISLPNGIDYSVWSNADNVPTVGFLNSVWNGRQWYANIPLLKGGDNLSARVWFSDIADFEGLDLSPDDGDFIDVGSTTGAQTPIVAIQGIPSGLLVFKETETFLITGSDYTNLSVRKLADIGTLSTGSVQPSGNGCIWAGREGIFYTDGNSIRNLSATLGDFWKNNVAGFSFANFNHIMGSYIWKNQYVLSMSYFNPGYAIRKAGSTSGVGTMTLCINLDTFAITTFSNLFIKDSIQMSSASGFPTLVLVDDGGTPGTASIVDTSLIHSPTGTGPDTLITRGGGSLGPDFYLETKKYDLGDPERKKLFKQLAMNYILAGTTLAMDTVPGLNQTGTAINTPWAAQASWANLRKKFTKRDTHIQFRLYQSSTAVTDVQIGPLAIGFKLQRVGRV